MPVGTTNENFASKDTKASW